MINTDEATDGNFHQPPDVPISTPVLLELGMHRSGTSCLAGMLQSAGFDAGTVEQWNPDNQRGNRENTEVMKLNDAVLKLNHSSWDKPPTSSPVFNDELREKRSALLKSFANLNRPWMFKDPRTLLTLPFWREAIPAPRRIGIFRHPLRVAMSLYFRNKKPLAEGLTLWMTYNLALLAEHERAPFPIVCFDLPAPTFITRVEDALRQECGDLLASGQLDPGKLNEFYSSDLVHHRDSGMDEAIWLDAGLAAVMQDALAMYSRLLALAHTEEPSGDEITTIEVDSISRLLAADHVAESGNPEEAESLYRTALASSPNPRIVWERIITLLNKSGQKEHALQACIDAVQACPDDAGLLLRCAEAKRQAGQIASALADADHVTQIAPQLHRAWSLKGECLIASRRWEDAIPAFRQAIQLQPLFRSYAGLGVALIQSGQPSEGEQIFHQALEIATPEGRPIIFNRWAQALIAQNKPESALPHLQSAVSMSKNPVIHLAYVRLLRQLGRADEATEHIDSALAQGIDSQQLRAARTTQRKTVSS